MVENDIPDVIKRWKERDPEKDTNRAGKAFVVSAVEIAGEPLLDLSVSRYKTVVIEEASLEPPSVILARLKELEAAIASDLDDLERLLTE